MQGFTNTVLVIFIAFSFELKSQDRNRLITNLQNLSSAEMAGRLPGTKGHEKAQEYIINQFEKIGLIPYDQDYRQSFDLSRSGNTIKGNNILGKIKGRSDNIIVISAHYDHLGQRNKKTYFGADDNASGVAALFFIAEYFKNKPPNNTLVFAAFDLEEAGLKGAKHFVSKLESSNVIFNLNLDMISRNDIGEIYASGTSHFPELKPLLQKVDAQNLEVEIKFGHDERNSKEQDWTFNSDHGEFYKANIPYIYFGVEDHVDYHKPSDIFEKIEHI